MGLHIGPDGPARATVRIRVSRSGADTVLHRRLRIGAAVYSSVARVAPANGSGAAPWSSIDVALGTVRGVVVSVRGAILALFRSARGDRGVETLTRRGSSYEVRGALIRGSRRVASWALDIKRTQDRTT